MAEGGKALILTEEEVLKADVKSMEGGVARRRLKGLVGEITFCYAGVLKLTSVGELEEFAISISSVMVRGIEYGASCIRWQGEVMEKTEVPRFLMPRHTIIVQASVLVPWARAAVEGRKRLLTCVGAFARHWFYPHLPEKARLPLEWRAGISQCGD